MKALKRYICLLLGIGSLFWLHIVFFQTKSRLKSCIDDKPPKFAAFVETFISERDIFYTKQTFHKPLKANSILRKNAVKQRRRRCNIERCFDFSRCKLGNESVKIYVYPNDGKHASPTFKKIISFIKQSKYYEPDPTKACLFVSDIDTLDRDPLSVDYQKYPLNRPLINNGKNHIMFNLYSGTWPDYSELDFSGVENPYAIIVKASMSSEIYRNEFDVSFPLFSKNHPEKGPTHIIPDSAKINFDKSSIEIVKKSQVKSAKYLLVFKGKRYIYGIGSETRNTLHHLHNNRDILIYTTCKHGKKWKELKDERCEHDNIEYEKYDYQTLMANSTFCLVPRGRRLASFRFLEALSMGCIPVVLSNSWVLPFSEIIDWSSAVLVADERLLFQIPDLIRGISKFQIESMRAKCIYLYNTYFSSIERIIVTAISIIENRINSHLAKEQFVWNIPNKTPMDPFLVDYGYNSLSEKFPSYYTSETKGFTALIGISRVISIHQLYKFLKASILMSKYVRKILILWTLKSPISLQIKQVADSRSDLITVMTFPENNNSMHARFACCTDDSLISTDAVFQLDPESNLIAEEIDFAYLVWESFPDRIVGFTARDHYFDSATNQWTYTSKWTNQYSIILLDAAIYHKYYNFLFRQHILSNSALASTLFDEECSGIAFNFLVGHVTCQSPVKVTQRKKTVGSDTLLNSWLAWVDRKTCFHRLQNLFGYIPLIKSKIRMEPLLYKDAVSSNRKKYRKLEAIT